MQKYLSMAMHFIASLVSYALLSLQRYTINYLMAGVIFFLLTLSLYTSFRYLLKYRETMLKLISIFAIFIYVSAVERAFILTTSLTGWEIYLGYTFLALITLEIIVLFYYVLRGQGGEKIVKMEYKGYA